MKLLLRALPLLGLTLSLAPAGAAAPKKPSRPPNVVVILSDDQGYADVSFNPHHPKEVSTPNLDALARSGVVCTAGYVTGHVCSPTRAGLMTGRYQQRAGIYTGGEGGSGLPLKEVIFPQHLKKAGYVSGALGKWHLGLTPEYNPVRRGFDEFYGFMNRGAHDYFKLDGDPPIYRGLKPVKDKGYLTTRLTEEAVDFVRRHKAKPFFLYLAYNAVHAPAQAPPEDVKRFKTGDKQRDVLMAMLKHLDAGVGRVVAALKDAGVYEDTLVFYLTDNGGSRAMNANNAPLRGYKQQDYEGGVRVPFVVSWPARLKAGTKCDVPVSSLDVLPTALAAAGLPLPKDKPLDGKDMLPALRGEVKELHPHLFWSSGGADGKWAVRAGRWKLVAVKDKVELFDLEADLGEKKDLAKKHPDKVKELTKLYDKWLDEMADPVRGRQPKRWKPDAPPLTEREKMRLEERKKKKAARRAEDAKPAAAETARKPNVVILFADDLGYAQPGCYGGKLCPTPHIDSIAKNGVRFTDGYSSACVCSPSRVGLMTGRHPCRTGHDANSTRPGRELDLKEVTSAQRLKAAGYATGLVGKWHLGDGDKYLPTARGFDTFFGNTGNLNGGKFVRGSKTIPDPPGAPVTSPLYRDEAIKFMTANADKPFFLCVTFNAVHAPQVASKAYVDKFKALPKRDQRFAPPLAELDDAVGAILAQLRKLKLEENTLVVFTSDNGGPGGRSGLRGGKWDLYEGGIRVPFVAQWKGRVPAGRVSSVPVGHLDLLPTALAAAGVALKPEWKLDGANLLPLLEGKAKTLDREALFWRFGVQFAVRAGDWKLVKPSKKDAPKLFDVAKDPKEATDLAAKHPERVKELKARWDKWNAGNKEPRWVDRRWDGDRKKE